MNGQQLSLFNHENLKGKLEALLFAAGEPVAYRDLMRVTESSMADLRYALDLLSADYAEADRGIHLIQMEKTCQLVTKPACYPVVQALLGLRQKAPLSKAAMETLSVIAYRQPVTRVEIEMIRGVSSSSSIQLLLDKGLIAEAGRKDAPGRPFLYRTTDTFLKTVRLKGLSELPAYDRFASGLTAEAESEIELSE